MKRRVTQKDWLPLARAAKKPLEAPTGEAFRPVWIDFERGIRVGNLEPHERITRILKYRLEQEYNTDFVTDRWGRGVFWQWICWVPRADREAKPISSGVNFGCAKFFITMDRGERTFRCGLAVERGFVSGKPAFPGILLRPDWDWHRLMKQCGPGTPLEKEFDRLLIREGFTASVSGGKGAAVFNAANYRSARQFREAARKAPPAQWAGFELFYQMTESEVRSSGGYDFVQAIMGVFSEVVPAMNACMQVTLGGDRGSAIPSGKAPGPRPQG